MRKSILDDYAGIAAERERIRREADGHAPTCVYVTHPALAACDCGAATNTVQPPCDTEQPRMEDYACGWALRQIMDERNALMRGFAANLLKSREPGEFTDGA
jgi:hypothetical protein